MTIPPPTGTIETTPGDVAPRNVGAASADAGRGSSERARYDIYRRQQARALLNLMPREAVRPLYRRAVRDGLVVTDKDPLGALAAYCESILPLPPFEMWRADLRAFPEAHLEGGDDFLTAPTSAAPATLEARAMTRDRSAWTAKLRGFREDDAWRGFIAFEDAASGTVHHTTLIFCEESSMDLRDRFLSFESGTLEAFLRSACL